MPLTWKMKHPISWRRRGLWTIMLIFLKFLLFGPFTWSSNFFFFFKSITKMTLSAPSHSCCLVWEPLWKETIVWSTNICVCDKDGFLKQNRCKHKNATCLNWNQSQEDTYFTTSWNSLSLQRRAQHRDRVSVPRCGALSVIHPRDSDGDLTVLQQSNTGN